MITRMLQKQVGRELSLIYENLYEFVKHFFSEETAELIGDLDYIIFLGSEYIYVQQHWMDEEGDDCVLELDIDYDEYNEWFKGLNTQNVSKG